MPRIIRCLPTRDSYKDIPVKGAINAIQNRAKEISDFWKNAHGWAPKEAAELLSKAKLDSFASLANCLKFSVLTPVKPGQESGRLIIAWAHLGSLLECTLQLFLGVHLRDYLKDDNRIFDKRKPKRPKLLLPHELTLENLRVFFNKSIWNDEDKKAWNSWISDVQQHRNAIHALKPRPLGTWKDLQLAVKQYYAFLEDINGRLPYPYGSF